MWSPTVTPLAPVCWTLLDPQPGAMVAWEHGTAEMPRCFVPPLSFTKSWCLPSKQGQRMGVSNKKWWYIPRNLMKYEAPNCHGM